MSLEEELHRIDHEIRKLKIQYDLYFVGANPKPPNDQRDAVDKMIKKHQSTHMKNLGDRFLYNSIVNKFNAFQELWNKAIRNREEGVRVHPLAARLAQQAALSETGGTHGPGGPAAGAQRAGAKVARGRGANGRRPEAEDGSWRVPTSGQDETTVRRLYQSFIAAKSKVGDEKKPAYDAFAREIARHTAALKGKVNCDAIDFKIDCKDNKVSLKAKPAK